MYRTNRWRIYTLLAWAVALVVLALVGATRGAPPMVAQAQSWPTPPPAPIGAFPRVVPVLQITPVPAPSGRGSMATQLDPIFAGPVPRLPPRPSTAVVTGELDPAERVTLHIDAGVLDQTVQITYQPLSPNGIPPPSGGALIQRAFQVLVYDYRATLATASFKYPIRLVLRPTEGDMAAAAGDPARLLLARYDSDANRWQNLVTTYRPFDGTLTVRILRPGLFAVIAQPPPVLR